MKDELLERTRAILPAHIGGLPCEMDAIVEDADHAGSDKVQIVLFVMPTVGLEWQADSRWEMALAWNKHVNIEALSVA